MHDLQAQLNEVAGASSIVQGDRGFGRRASAKQLSKITGEAVTVHHYDEADGKTQIETVQDCTTILEANKRDRNSGHDGYSASREWRHVGRIPLVVIEQFHRRGIDLLSSENKDLFMALLDDNDWKSFRSHEGKLSKKPKRDYFFTEDRKN